MKKAPRETQTLRAKNSSWEEGDITPTNMTQVPTPKVSASDCW